MKPAPRRVAWRHDTPHPPAPAAGMPHDCDACGGARGGDACRPAAAVQGIVQWLLAEPAHKLSRARLREFLPEVCNGEVGARPRAPCDGTLLPGVARRLAFVLIGTLTATMCCCCAGTADLPDAACHNGVGLWARRR